MVLGGCYVVSLFLRVDGDGGGMRVVVGGCWRMCSEGRVYIERERYIYIERERARAV